MDRVENSTLPAAIALGICTMLGLIFGGLLLGTRIRDFKRADRYVEVKGLVERTVKSDSATWTIAFTEGGDDLTRVLAGSDRDKAVVVSFLKSQGFNQEEVSVNALTVTDRSTQQYGNNSKAPRFVVSQSITVQTGDVDRVAAASEKTADIVRAGVVIGNASGGAGSSVTYKFNGLNALKPDMITEATRNARASANRFAADSGSQLGAIRSANQGVFSITAAGAGPTVNETEAEGGYGAEQQADASIMKKIRVVSTIDYYLVN